MYIYIYIHTCSMQSTLCIKSIRQHGAVGQLALYYRSHETAGSIRSDVAAAPDRCTANHNLMWNKSAAKFGVSCCAIGLVRWLKCARWLRWQITTCSINIQAMVSNGRSKQLSRMVYWSTYHKHSILYSIQVPFIMGYPPNERSRDAWADGISWDFKRFRGFSHGIFGGMNNIQKPWGIIRFHILGMIISHYGNHGEPVF